ncbi:MAG: gliding motility-associated ABC transporter substrate-binding protein GldG [Bacteroidetes bacterium]|nr:gliding motility-associated ABC transporter substrate-binding protein GldG [Bacteroidota bacterium]
MKNKKKNIKFNNITQIIYSLIIIILLNIIGSFVYTRFDLTTEKRYSLSPATKTLLKKIDDIVYFKIYLEGDDFPAGFKRLSNSTKEMLDEFRAYNSNIQYEFINPNSITDKKQRNDLYKLLVEKGIQPTNLQVKGKGGSSQQVIFPGAEVSYKTQTMTLPLLMDQMGIESENVLNNSIQALEYNISNVIRKLSIKSKPKIAIIEGHGELNNYSMYDITSALSQYYQVERVRIDEKINKLTNRVISDTATTKISNIYKAIIIAKPDSAFSEKDKFIIDQYIMYGGKVLWLIDPVMASMDSLRNSTQTVGLTNELNLADQLFRYGVRLNTNLIMDISALQIPIVTGKVGNQPQTSFLPWYFFPIIMPTANHPIVKNLNAIKTEFVSSIDTIDNGIKKTILLTSSKYSRLVNTPAIIDLAILKKEPEERLYNKSFESVAVLLEGEFVSNFSNRMTSEISQSDKIGFLQKSKPTSMIIISDGDIIKSQFHYSKGYPLPLGYDQYTGQMFGNKEFILNCVNYLCDDSGLISVRSRELKLRMLDKTKIEKSKIQWQVINVVLPIVIVILFGFLMTFMRKHRYTR